MSIIYWLLLISYLTAISLAFFFTGVNWYRIDTKYKHSPQKFVVVAYILNFLVQTYAFSVPIWVQFIMNVFYIAGVVMGTNFQCIGLTGGIACGKSTVSNILAENGMDIIDADKISKDVSTHHSHRDVMLTDSI